MSMKKDAISCSVIYEAEHRVVTQLDFLFLRHQDQVGPASGRIGGATGQEREAQTP
jgi:hypothetical protein